MNRKFNLISTSDMKNMLIEILGIPSSKIDSQSPECYNWDNGILGRFKVILNYNHLCHMEFRLIDNEISEKMLNHEILGKAYEFKVCMDAILKEVSNKLNSYNDNNEGDNNEKNNK